MTQVPPTVDTVLQAVRESLDHDNAIDVVVIDLSGKTSIADFMIVACGTSKRHIVAMADHVLESVKKLGMTTAAVEGATQCDWVLIDAGDVIIHLFRPEVRQFYALERLWGAPALVAGASTERRAGFAV
jgi:ribosome-associated protein